ncbi:MAG TPA: PNGase F N-terminal domain-containing protein [Prolixibacteraceae bacterium]|nr:PNGase F N-terminal domain-containing protein [Prolixibacteraceae bacterium]
MMKKLTFIFLLSTLVFQGFASQKQKPRQVELTFQMVVNGKATEDGPKSKLLCSSDACKFWTESDPGKLIPNIAKETAYVDFAKKMTYQVAQFSEDTLINTPAYFQTYPTLAETGETALILGYQCKKVKTSLRSNSIDIWYTTELGVKGTPAMAYGIPDGLVLKVVRNGNYEIVATTIKKLKTGEVRPILPSEMGQGMELPLYRHLITEKLIATVNVFTNEQVSFGNEITNPVDTNSEMTFKYASGTVLLKKVKLPVVSDDTQLYAELYQHSNGDAYDRTGSVFMVPQDKEKSFLEGLRNGTASLPYFEARNGKKYQGVIATPNFSPLVELMRFFTPFGIGQFNDKVTVYGQQWEDSTFYKQEVSELLPLLQGERWIGVFIGNYDKGGHKVSLKLKYYPGSREFSDKPKKKYWTYPLFNTLNVMEMAGQEYGTMFETDSLRTEVTIPEGVKNIKLRYITTGHGGWDGGDEYNQKMNTLLVDEKVLFQYTPWRCDCGTYRKYNPASGNFWNGITSSDGSRSGWCPGTATNPVFFPVGDVKPGKHTFSVAIPIGKNEGGSFSAWNVSAILIGEY